MDSNTHSTQGPTGPADDLAALTAAIDRLASRDLHRLPDTALADQTLQLQQLRDRLDGVILRHLAAVDARGAAGAEQARQFGSTASWLRARLQMTTTTAASQLRTARALFCGPLPESGTALCAGELSVAHAVVLAASTLHLPDHAIDAAEPTLLEAARRLDPPGWVRSSPTPSTSSTLMALTNGRDGVMSATGCGSPSPLTRWWSSTRHHDP
jgi:transposase